MKKILFFVTLLISFSIFGQTTLLDPTGDGGFETGTTATANGWTATTGTATQNQWIVGTAYAYGGSRGCYVTNATGTTPPPNSYTTNATRVTHLYRNFTIPTSATTATLSFYWKATGESCCDYMSVYLEPATNSAPVYGTQKTLSGTAPTGIVNAADGSITRTKYNASYAGYTTSQQISINIPSSYFTNTAYRLTFEWRNDGSTGTNPPAAIDNVSITYTTTPTITTSVSSLTAFTACTNVASSEQTFTVSGVNLTANISVAAPTGFQVSTTTGSGFGSSVTLTQSSGTVGVTTIYARMLSATTPVSANIACTSTGATTKNISVSGTVTSSAPSITTNPSNSSINGGSNATFTAVGSNSPTSYTWQVSTDGGTNWTTISNGGVYSGATTATLTVTAPSITMSGYKYQVSATNCVGTSSYSTVATLTISYCTPSSSGNSYYINSFSTSNGVTNISNSGTTTSATSAGYSNYSATISCSQYANTSLSFVATTNASLGGGFSLWVDWNSDGSFASGERVYGSSLNSLTTTGTQTFTVPSGQSTGNYRMRLIFDYNSSGSSHSSCPSTGSIEVEDYTLTVVAPSIPTITSLGSSSGCVGSNLVINGTNLSGVSASNVTIGGTAVSSIVSNTGTVLTVVVGSGTTGTIQVVTAGGTATSSSSFTINQLPTLSYAGTPYTYSQNVAISNLTPSTTGSPTTFSSSPTLPTGLSINGTTGVISGTPSATQTATTYTITGTNDNSCSNTTTISIGISPQNSTCANAITLTCGSNTSGSTSGTTGVASGIPTASTYGSGVSDYGVWYKIDGDNSTYTLVVTPSSGYDIEVDVISGSCGTYTTVTSDDSYASGSAETVIFTANQGTTYYVYLAHYLSGSTTTGTFTINTSATAATPSAITGTSSVCPSTTGLAYSVTNTSGYTYNWTLPSGFTQTGGSNTNSITLTSGTSSGTLSVTATNSCGTSSSSTLTITVKDAPTGVSAGSDASICLGGSSNLSGVSNNVNTNLVTLNSDADFATTTNNGGWSYAQTSNAGGSTSELRYAGSLVSGTVNKYLQGPSTLSGSGATTLTLTFKSMVDWYTGTFTLKFQTSLDGTTWNDRWSISPTADVAASTVTVDLASDIGTTFYYRFLFSGNKYNINYWYIDDIVIGATFPPTYSWSPTSDLSSSTIYNPTATPSTTTVYTLTATANGCSVTDDVQITVNTPTISSINTATGQTMSSGDFVWSGNTSTSWTTISNWYTHNGTSLVVATTDPTSTSNVYVVPSTTTSCISATNSPLVNGNDNIVNLTVVNGATLDLSNNTVSMTGNLKVDGNVVGDGTIKLNGTGTQTISGTGTITLPNLEVNKSSGSVTVSNPLNISTLLTMVSGNINNSTNTIQIGSSALNTGSIDWTSGTITGVVKRWFAASTNSTQASGIFPVGNTFYNRYVIINYTQAPTGGYITAQYKTGIPSIGTTGLPLTASSQLISQLETQGYWEIIPDSYSGSLSTSDYSITLRGNNLPTITDVNTARIIKSPGSSHTTWTSNGTHSGTTGVFTDFTITNTSCSGFSYFNIGSPSGAALGVEMSYFDGYYYGERTNLIVWKTQNETDCSHFNLYNSEDGITWIKIGTVSGSISSTTPIEYTLPHNMINPVINYYKLEQHNINGVYETFGPISIDNTIVVDKTVVKYFNLSGQEININTELPTGVYIEVYSDGTMKKIIK